jgi:protein gp37
MFNYLILTKRPERITDCLPGDWGSGYPNVWLLVSTETQELYRERWGILLGIPAAIRGLSAEPLLSPIVLTPPFPDWIITGGESDPVKPRLSDPAWFMSIADQCRAEHIPLFHKQNGGSKKLDGHWGGRELDGRTWNQFPTINPKRIAI